MDLKQFKLSVTQLAEEREIPRERVVKIIEQAVAAAYKKDYGQSGQKIEAEMDPVTGDFKFWQVKEVVEEDMILTEEEMEKLKEGEELEEKKIHFNPQRHILLEEAREDNPDIEPGDEIRISLEPHRQYGRIAAQTAKQVILQRLKETERDLLYEEFKEREGDVVSGTVQRVGRGRVYFDLGKTLGIMTREEQIPGEYYEIGQRFKLFILSVEEGTKGPVVYLSRAFPKLVTKLFEVEVPEISSGEVEIKSIAREPGSRTKIGVVSHDEEIDPIGATIGQRGSRVSAVINELGGEKIDIVKYSDELEEYIKNALSPAKVLQVKLEDKNRAVCVVPDDQLSLAIGKEGQNVRLAAELTGWKIDVQSIEEWEEEDSGEAEETSSSKGEEDVSEEEPEEDKAEEEEAEEDVEEEEEDEDAEEGEEDEDAEDDREEEEAKEEEETTSK